MPDDKPLVSCLMITGLPGRRPLAELAVESFRRQIYGNRELVVVNTSGESWFDDGDPRIRETVLDANEPLGSLRNRSVSLAEGAICLQWDDDDYHAADRIWRQWEKWRPGRANVLRRQIRLDLERGEHVAVDGSRWKCGGIMGTIAFDRKLFGEVATYDPAETCGEDTTFAGKLADAGLVDAVDNNPRVYWRTYHGANTWGREHVLTAGGAAKMLDASERRAADAVAWMYRDKSTDRPDNPCRTIEDVATVLRSVPWMTYGRAKRLNQVFNHAGITRSRAIEIGTMHGVSACYFATMFDHVLAVDIERSWYFSPRIEDTAAACGLLGKITITRAGADSLGALRHAKVPFVYVDGAHDFKRAMTDFAIADSLLLPGGFVAIDDYRNPVWPDVEKAVQAFDWSERGFSRVPFDENDTCCVFRKSPFEPGK